MGQPVVGLAEIFLRQANREHGHIQFRFLAEPGDAFDGVAIGIARGKIHQRINLGGIGAQSFFHHALALHKFLPVQGVEQAEAANGIADRSLGRGLVLAFTLNQLSHGQALLGQPFLDPAHGEFDGRRFFLDTA